MNSPLPRIPPGYGKPVPWWHPMQVGSVALIAGLFVWIGYLAMVAACEMGGQ